MLRNYVKLCKEQAETIRGIAKMENMKVSDLVYFFIEMGMFLLIAENKGKIGFSESVDIDKILNDEHFRKVQKRLVEFWDAGE